MSREADIAVAEAEVNYYRDRISLARARLYSTGDGEGRIEELERQLVIAQRRLDTVRATRPDGPAA